jgi:hypothetical protein
MAEEGVELPRLDAAIFADTGWEPPEVYQWLDWLQSRTTIPIHRVSAGNLRQDVLASLGQGGTGTVRQPPFYVRTVRGGDDHGQVGMLWRKCTDFYKIRPIRRRVRQLAVARHGGRPPAEAVEQWIGISWDEVDRQKQSGVQYIKNRFPLVEKRLTAADCLAWFAKRGYPSPPKSACIGCPYLSNARWRQIRDTRPELWADAVDFDRQIRVGLPGVHGEAYLHRQAVPLEEADLRTKEEKAWGFREECSGMCGV